MFNIYVGQDYSRSFFTIYLRLLIAIIQLKCGEYYYASLTSVIELVELQYNNNNDQREKNKHRVYLHNQSFHFLTQSPLVSTENQQHSYFPSLGRLLFSLPCVWSWGNIPLIKPMHLGNISIGDYCWSYI